MDGGDVVGLASCALVLAGGAFVYESGAAFVLGGCAWWAIGRELLSLKGGAFLGGHLCVAEGVHGLKGHTHGGILWLILGCRDVGDLVHIDRDVDAEARRGG